MTKGGRIDIGIVTVDNSLFQMGVYLYDENLTLHGSSIATGSGGIDGETITAPHSGYYHVVIMSGDSTQGRSSGRAYLKSYY